MRKEPSAVLAGPDSNCMLIACWNVHTGLSESQILAAALKHGFNEDYGVPTWKIPAMCRSLKLKIEEVAEVKKAWDEKEAYTVNQARSQFNDAVYLCVVSGHVFVLNHGDVIDPNQDNYGVRREVIRLIRVVNSDVQPFDKTVTLNDEIEFKVDFKVVSREHSASRKKFEIIDMAFGQRFRVRDITSIMPIREVEAMLKRGVFKKI